MSLSMEELPAIPSILIQAFPLEAYLRNLSNKLSDNMNALERSLSDLQGGVKLCSSSVAQMHMFLRQEALLELQEKMAESGITLPEGVSVESYLPEFLRDGPLVALEDGDAVAGLQSGEAKRQNDNRRQKMQVLKEKMSMQRVERSRMKEEWEKKARQQNEDSRKRLEQMCEELERSQKRYMDELGRITVWFQPSHAEEEEDGALRSGTGSNRHSEAGTNNSELQEMMRSAPLFVEFRRLLMRDMMDRLGEARDEQSMTLGNSIVSLREEMRKEIGRSARAAAAAAEGGGVDGGITGGMERQLKTFDRNYVQRGEVVSTLQEKADRVTVAQKADKAYVKDLEERLLERIADLEERLAIYEAERAEFRRILRSVVDVHRRGEDVPDSSSGSSPSGRPARRRDGDGGAARTKEILPNFVVLDNTADPRTQRGCDVLAVEEPRRKKHTPSSRAGRKSDLTTPPLSSRQQQAPQRQMPRGVAGTVVDSGRPTLGLTVNQEAYANYVTSELNRRVVENLPPLPYERGCGQ